jgi:hypothetical protein
MYSTLALRLPNISINAIGCGSHMFDEGNIGKAEDGKLNVSEIRSICILLTAGEKPSTPGAG